MEDFKKLLDDINFSAYLKKLKTKLVNKKVIIYGSGTFFKYVLDNYDLKDINIIGISDLKFEEDKEGQEFLGFKIIPKNKILSYKPDCIIVATLKYISIVEDFEENILNKTDIKVYPLAKMPFLKLVKEIWGCN